MRVGKRTIDSGNSFDCSCRCFSPLPLWNFGRWEYWVENIVLSYTFKSLNGTVSLFCLECTSTVHSLNQFVHAPCLGECNYECFACTQALCSLRLPALTSSIHTQGKCATNAKGICLHLASWNHNVGIYCINNSSSFLFFTWYCQFRERQRKRCHFRCDVSAEAVKRKWESKKNNEAGNYSIFFIQDFFFHF